MLAGLFGGMRVKTNRVEFRAECYVDSKVETGEDSNIVIECKMECKKAKSMKLIEEDAPGAILPQARYQKIYAL